MTSRVVRVLVAAAILGGVTPARAATTVSISFSAAKTLGGNPVFRFDRSVSNVTSSNVILRVAATTTNLPVTLRCADGSGAAVSCSVGPVRRVTIDPRDPFVAGQRYTAFVNPEGELPVVDSSSLNAVPHTARNFIASTEEQETSLGANYSWRKITSEAAVGGSYRAERTAGAAMSFYFTGRSIAWVTKTGPRQGKASVYIDGVKRATVNNYASADHYGVVRTFGGLPSGAHRFTVGVLGVRGSSRGLDTWIAVDDFSVDGTRASAPHTRYAWDDVASSGASGGHRRRTVAQGSSVTFVFRGLGIDWYTVVGPSQGTAQMYVDGVLKRTVDNHASAAHYGVRRSLGGLSDAVHRLTIVATGGEVSIDRFIVRLPSLVSFRRLGAWVDLFDYGLDPATAVADMASRGVKAVFIETARYNSDSAFDNPGDVGEWIEEAHAAGMKVVGWYFPAYSEYLDIDVARTVAIAKYRSPAGQSFDALAIDVEYKGKSSTLSEWNSGISEHLRRVRAGVGKAYPVGAIVPSPIAMKIYPTHWTGFPWGDIGRHADIVLPMAYWSYRTDCASKPQHCPYQYAVGNVNESRTKTALPVHVIGGIANDVTASETSDFVKGARDAKAYGGSMYDYATTKANSSLWSPLSGFNLL